MHTSCTQNEQQGKSLKFSLGQPAHPMVPRLKLPMKHDKVDLLSRSARRKTSPGGLFQSQGGGGGQSTSERVAPRARQKLSELAVKLGQYC